MNKTSYLPVTATIIGILLAASFGYSLNPTAHAVSSDTEWHLTVTGLVEHPLNLTLADLLAMPQTTIYAPIICAGPPPSFVTEGNWTGVRLWLLLQEAGVLNEAIKVAFYAQDGFTTDLTIDMAKRNDVIIAYEKNGEPLKEMLRLVVPDSWGYKWISQLTRIELVNYNFLGFYESRGYSDSGSYSGDCTGDAKVDLRDLVTVARAYGTKPGQPRWNPNADINNDGRIDLRDLVMVARNYGKKYP